ncbi:MAG: AMP-binding protein [Pseudoalteromonas sp.]|uniref:AMP-binding protein n=1 Tax=Pseudoalteromonas sp. TaxID=53249 RepID=UPI001D9C7556|nr:AMP-binding protein [Pseudoalteromonas sp.]NRA80051.1 AMP-binding protein [Pseudoalteromonas sp.]
MNNSYSIIESLYNNSNEIPDEIAFEFITDTSLKSESITFQQLYSDASCIAKSLLKHATTGDCILLLYPPSIEYVKAFFACLMAGVVAIPLYPPKKNSKSEKVFTVAQASKARFALTTEKEIITLKDLWSTKTNKPINFIYTKQLLESENNENVLLPKISETSPAFLQYTSGSTGNPKGVIITHGNILGNTQYLTRVTGAHCDDVFVNWLPLFHDLGLVTAVLWTTYLGCKSVLMAPATFVGNPIVWFEAISKYGGTFGGAPNFAFDLCVDKIADKDLFNIDLSTWRVAYNAAEPVRYQTIERFAKRFSIVGFSRESFYPSYGMAESTVFMTGRKCSEKLASIKIDRKGLAENKVIVKEGESDCKKEECVRLVGNGLTDSTHFLKIVNPDTHEVMEEREIGEVWFSGASVSPGYWKLKELTEESFGNLIKPEDGRSYFRTGDLGFILGENLFITGRINDVIILKGKNYYPQDIESTVKYCHKDIHKGYTAAFEVSGKLVVVTEVNRTAVKKIDPISLIQKISHSIYTQHGIAVNDVVLLPPYKIPMTSSGKIRRSQCKSLYQNGSLKGLYQAENGGDKILPKGEVEGEIYTIWCHVLGVPEVCVNAGIFEVGGDSIKAVQIASEVSKRYNIYQEDEYKILSCESIREMAQVVSLLIMCSSGSNVRGEVVKI